MSGYPYGGNPPQYPPPQNQIYPQISNPANAPPPGQPSQPTNGGYAMPGQNLQYPFQPAPGFLLTQYPGQPGQGYQGQPSQQSYSGQPSQQSYMGQPSQPGYPGQPSLPSYPGQPSQQNYSGQPGTQGFPGQQGHPASMSYPGISPTPTTPRFPNVTATPSPDIPAVEWIPSSPQHAHALTDKAVVGGYEAHDGSPLWIIRTWFEKDLIPGKLAIKHHSAFVPWGGKEHSVQSFEVCCARPDRIRWVESRDGVIPPKAISAGYTSSREPLYIGRAKHQGSLTPGKVHPSHKQLYISFGGQEIPIRVYEVLCSV